MTLFQVHYLEKEGTTAASARPGRYQRSKAFYLPKRGLENL